MKRFRISFSVDAPNLGDVLAKIHGLADDLDVGLIETIPHTKNTPRKRTVTRGVTRDMLLKTLNEQVSKSIALVDARKVFEQAGLKPDAVYGAKDALLKKGLIDFKNGIVRLK